jgi:hypothetical protein
MLYVVACRTSGPTVVTNPLVILSRLFYIERDDDDDDDGDIVSCIVIYRNDGIGIPYLSRKVAFSVPRLG